MGQVLISLCAYIFSVYFSTISFSLRITLFIYSVTSWDGNSLIIVSLVVLALRNSPVGLSTTSVFTERIYLLKNIFDLQIFRTNSFRENKKCFFFEKTISICIDFVNKWGFVKKHKKTKTVSIENQCK